MHSLQKITQILNAYPNKSQNKKNTSMINNTIGFYKTKELKNQILEMTQEDDIQELIKNREILLHKLSRARTNGPFIRNSIEKIESKIKRIRSILKINNTPSSPEIIPSQFKSKSITPSLKSNPIEITKLSEDEIDIREYEIDEDKNGLKNTLESQQKTHEPSHQQSSTNSTNSFSEKKKSNSIEKFLKRKSPSPITPPQKKRKQTIIPNNDVINSFLPISDKPISPQNEESNIEEDLHIKFTPKLVKISSNKGIRTPLKRLIEIAAAIEPKKETDPLIPENTRCKTNFKYEDDIYLTCLLNTGTTTRNFAYWRRFFSELKFSMLTSSTYAMKLRDKPAGHALRFFFGDIKIFENVMGPKAFQTFRNEIKKKGWDIHTQWWIE